MNKLIKIRLLYLGLSVLCFITCALIVKYFSSNLFIRGFLGDVVVIFLVYFFFKSICNIAPFKLAIFTLLLADTIEFSQYFNVITALNLQHNAMARVVLGTVFDPYDLLAYSIGAVTVYFMDTWLIQKNQNQVVSPTERSSHG